MFAPRLGLTCSRSHSLGLCRDPSGEEAPSRVGRCLGTLAEAVGALERLSPCRHHNSLIAPGPHLRVQASAWARTPSLGSVSCSKVPKPPPPQFPAGPTALRPPRAQPSGLASPALGAGTCPHPSASPPLHFPLPLFPPSPPPRGEAAAAAAAAAEAEAAAAAAAGGARLGLRGRAGGHGGQHVPGRR